MNRERVEDLGVLSVMLTSLLEHDLWTQAETDWDLFAERYKDADAVERLQQQILWIRDKLYECSSIADGDEGWR